jgi:glutathione S-transferase
LPREPLKRAVARIWIDWANVRFVPAFGALLRGPTAAEQESATRDLGDALGYLEKEGFGNHSGDGPFFFGAEPGLVDFTLYPWFERWAALDHYRSFAVPQELRRVNRWRAELASLAAVHAHENPVSYYVERYARFAAHVARAVS